MLLSVAKPLILFAHQFLIKWFCWTQKNFERKDVKVEALLQLVKNLSYIISSIHWGYGAST